MYDLIWVKVKLSLYRALGPWEDEVPRFSRQLASEGGKVVNPTHRPPLPQEISLVLISIVDWGSSVGRVIRYGLDGLGIESRWVQVFPHPSRPALRPTQPPIQWVLGLSGGKAAGAWH